MELQAYGFSVNCFLRTNFHHHSLRYNATANIAGNVAADSPLEEFLNWGLLPLIAKAQLPLVEIIIAMIFVFLVSCKIFVLFFFLLRNCITDKSRR